MAPRSRSGCLTCRSRKLKCSEEKPVCAQCAKANRDCVPSSGITFRHQQNPSMNGDDQGESGLKSFYGYKETFGRETTWVPIPKSLTFKHTNNPYNDDEGEGTINTSVIGEQTPVFGPTRSDSELSIRQTAYPLYATHGLEALSAVASQGQYHYPLASAARMIQQDSPRSRKCEQPLSPEQLQGPSRNLDFILNPPTQLPSHGNSNIDPRLHTQTPEFPSPASSAPSHVRNQSSFAAASASSPQSSKGPIFSSRRRSTITDPQLVFLLRDFSERSGHWMDLFDLDQFFASRVPVLAVECPLLLYSCAALSCKSLARINGRKAGVAVDITRTGHSVTEQWRGSPLEVEGWKNKGIEYYDLAVSLLRQALAGATRSTTASLPEDINPQTMFIAQSSPLPATDSDEVLASIAILCVYEFLDGSSPEWSRHLDGAKTLLDILRDRLYPLTLPPSPVFLAQQSAHQVQSHPYTRAIIREPSQGQKAVFWNFARQDMLSAFIGSGSTRLDTNDLPMWRNAGLVLDSNGSICPSNPQHPNYLPSNTMADDMISNALVWVLAKLVNLIAQPDDGSKTQPPSKNAGQPSLVYECSSIEMHLQVWYEGLPDAFHAPATGINSGVTGIEEKWFPRPMCASTMQWYHFARIQLMDKKSALDFGQPVFNDATSTEIPEASRDTMRRHAIEIVAISLGRSDEGTRIHSVQPLWTAGQVLGQQISITAMNINHEIRAWQREVIKLLRGISSDMGWETSNRVRDLLETWQLPPNWLDQSPDEE